MLGWFLYFISRFSNGSPELTLFADKSFCFRMFNLALYSRKNCCYVSKFYHNYITETQNKPIWYIFRPTKIIILPELSYLNSIFKIFLARMCFYPISAQSCVSYRNQSFFLLCKTNDWFLYETQHRLKCFNTQCGWRSRCRGVSIKNSIRFYSKQI